MSIFLPDRNSQPPVRATSDVFHSSISGGSWPTSPRQRDTTNLETFPDQASPPKRRITLQTFNINRSATQKSTASTFGYLTVPRNSESAQNGNTTSRTTSRLREIFWWAVNLRAPQCAIGSLTMASGSLPFLVSSAFAFGLPQNATVADFMPEIEVKSKKKNDGRAVWKQIRAIIDTGCHSGNWVTRQFLDRLGITGKLLDLTEDEARGSQSATGQEFHARGAVMLTWRGVAGRGLPNCTKTFKLRFLVSNVLEPDEPPYDILIGLKSVCECKILFAPTLVHDIPTLPPKKKNKKKQDVVPQKPEGGKISERRKESARLLKEDSPTQTTPVSPPAIPAPTARPLNQRIQGPPTPVDSRTSSFASTQNTVQPKHISSKTRTNSSGPVAVNGVVENKNETPTQSPKEVK